MRVTKQPAEVFVAHGVARLRRCYHVPGGDLRYEWCDEPVKSRTRSFSRTAAFMSLARAYCRAHCECEEGELDVGVPDYRCRFHADHYNDVELRTGKTARGYGARVRARLARYLRWLDSMERAVERAVRLKLERAS